MTGNGMGLDELDAMLAAAEVKEDYLDLGLPGEGGQQVPSSERNIPERLEDKMIGAGVASSGKKYKVKRVDALSEICFSYIGSGASFCLRKECQIKHGGPGLEGSPTFETESGGQIVIIKAPHVAFAAPTLKASAVEAEVIDAWEGQSFSLEDWQQMFRASNQGEGYVMSIQDIKLEVDASRNVEAFRTPGKRKKVSIAEPERSFQPYDKTFTSPQAESLFKRSANSSVLAESMVSFDRALDSLSIGVEKALKLAADGSDVTERTAEAAHRKATGVEDRIGSAQVMDFSEFAHPTLWGAVSIIGAELTDLKNRKLPPPPPVNFEPIRQEAKAAQDRLTTSMTKISAFTRSFATAILTRIASVEEEIKRQAKVAAVDVPRAATSRDEFDSLLNDAGFSGKGGSIVPPRPSGNEERMSNLENRLESCLRANMELEQKFAQVIADNDNDAVKFAGLGLRSLEETAAWVSVHFPKRSYGLIFDVYLLLDLISDEGASTQKDLMTEMKRRDELDIASEAEGQALTAFLSEVPRILHANSGSISLVADDASHLSKVGSYKAWSNGTGGMKKTIEKKLSKLKMSLREILYSELGVGSVAYTVAVEALEKSISWIGVFLSFIDQTYEALHVRSSFSPGRAWSLTTQLVCRIFSDLHSVRVGTTKAMGKGREAICPAILWSVFRTHDKMAAFEDANFEDHPSIASEYVKFLATNSGLDILAKVQDEVGDLKSKVKDLEKQAVSAAGKADKASSVADLAKKTTETFARRLTVVESKLLVQQTTDLRVEHGIKYFRHKRRVYLFGSNTLEWLLSFSPKDWAAIYVSDKVPASELLAKVSRRMNVIGLTGTQLIPTCDVLLGAGTGEELAAELKTLPLGIPLLLVCPSMASGSRHLRKLQSWPVCHQLVGGTTLCRARFWVRGWAFAQLAPTVSRSVGHLIDHGDLPKACSSQPAFEHLAPGDLLPMTTPLPPLVFETHATRTKWGTRPVSSKELGLCLDAPQWIVSNPVLLHLFLQRHKVGLVIPLKMLQSPLQACLSAIDAPSETRSRPPPPLKSVLEDPRGSWLPSLKKWLPSTWVNTGAITSKAAKADDADIHTGVWDSRITTVLPLSASAITQLRRVMFGWWGRRVATSFRGYLRRKYGRRWLFELQDTRKQRAYDVNHKQQGGQGVRRRANSQRPLDHSDLCQATSLLSEAKSGCQILTQVLGATWWDWECGSSLFFWRWDTNSQLQAARDGMQIFVQGPLPTHMRPARAPSTEKAAQLGPKIDKVRRRNYILPGPTSNLTDFFDVPKGEDDIRIVYNGTSSGLNEALWAPGFYLPNADAAARLLMFSSFCVDADLGEMFLNFPMDPALRPYAGVEFTSLRAHLSNTPRDGRILERWERLFMGMRPSPYNAVRYFYWGEEFARGNPFDEQNALRYDRVILNLPGMKTFDPAKPNVMKWNDLVDRLAGDLITFVDDLRASGYDRENAWQVARQITSRLQYLGIQDAARKRRPSSQEAGAWAGCIFIITMDAIFKTVSQDKWEKGKAIIKELVGLCKNSSSVPDLNHKDLERKRGYLVHLSMTFPSLVPFLKGLHLTIDSWREMRDDDGWKYSYKEERIWFEHQLEEGLTEEDIHALLNTGAPNTVHPVPRFLDDLIFLEQFFASVDPPRVMVRSTMLFMVIYGFGDASGKGFGSTFTVKDGVSYRIGVWKPDESSESSNWKEFTNVVESLEEEAASGRLANGSVYFFTDNTTVENALYKGTSLSKKLLELVIRVKLLETQYGIRIMVSHVSGRRMIAEGGDGVSRGSLNEGVMAGEAMLSFVPLHLSAVERSPDLLKWIRTWASSDLEELIPLDWFQKAHDIRSWKKQEGEPFQRPVFKPGIFGWFPPPGAADVALEQLRIARLKRQDSTHVFVCPRLLCPVWLKQFNKACDLIFKIPPGAPGWPDEMFEPLLIGVCFPYLRFRPWQFKGTPKLSQVARQLHDLRKDIEVDRGPFLRKFWNSTHRLLSMPEYMVPRMLYFEHRNSVSCGTAGGPERQGGRRRSRSTDMRLGEKKPKRQK